MFPRNLGGHPRGQMRDWRKRHERATTTAPNGYSAQLSTVIPTRSVGIPNRRSAQLRDPCSTNRRLRSVTAMHAAVLRLATPPRLSPGPTAGAWSRFWSQFIPVRHRCTFFCSQCTPCNWCPWGSGICRTTGSATPPVATRISFAQLADGADVGERWPALLEACWRRTAMREIPLPRRVTFASPGRSCGEAGKAHRMGAAGSLNARCASSAQVSHSGVLPRVHRRGGRDGQLGFSSRAWFWLVAVS
jgi:hypothetical protein